MLADRRGHSERTDVTKLRGAVHEQATAPEIRTRESTCDDM